MTKVAVIGAGLAGLAAGIRLLTERPGMDVTIWNMGHHLGGKATSYRDGQGYNIDHGFHAISVNYQRFLALMKQAGIDTDRALVKDSGTWYFDETTHGIRQSGGGPKKQLNADERKMLAFFMKNLRTLYQDPEIDRFDDICWTRWAVEHGLDERLTKTRSFRFSRDALFNWPHEISAYINMMSLRLLGGSDRYYLTRGTYGETLIAPIVRHFEKLGGRVVPYHKLVGFRHEQGRVTRLDFAVPDPQHHDQGRKKWDRKVRVLDHRIELKDFDQVVFAMPVDNFRELNRDDEAFWKPFPGIGNLQTVATLCLQVWTEKPVLDKVLPGVSACINLLDEPLPMVIDTKQLRDEYRENPKIGSALEWVGQESGFEKLSDVEIAERAFVSLASIRGVVDVRKAGILKQVLGRNTSNHERYLLTDPGTLRFRPHSKTHLRNLFLAGDWIRNEVDVPTMEGAICSGQTAADTLIHTL